MATQAEDRKEAKYTHLNSAHTFTPVAIETSDIFGAKTVCAGGWSTAGASHWGSEIHHLSYSEALGGSATWQLSIDAGQFRSVLLFLRILICM